MHINDNMIIWLVFFVMNFLNKLNISLLSYGVDAR